MPTNNVQTTITKEFIRTWTPKEICDILRVPIGAEINWNSSGNEYFFKATWTETEQREDGDVQDFIHLRA